MQCIHMLCTSQNLSKRLRSAYSRATSSGLLISLNSVTTEGEETVAAAKVQLPRRLWTKGGGNDNATAGGVTSNNFLIKFGYRGAEMAENMKAGDMVELLLFGRRNPCSLI